MQYKKYFTYFLKQLTILCKKYHTITSIGTSGLFSIDLEQPFFVPVTTCNNTSKMQKLYKIQSNIGAATFKKMNDKEHMVIPVTMIVEGVLNNALVATDEFIPHAWNGRPVTVNHPQVNGEDVSANSPAVLEKFAIGQIFNARVDGKKLRAEIWINLELAEKLNHNELIKALKAGNKMEVSTGYFCFAEQTTGKINGNSYVEIHKDIKPDHLALLPNDIGACSIKDGAGTFNKRLSMKVNEAIKVITNALTKNKEDGMGNKTEIIKELIDNKHFDEKEIKALTAMSDEGLKALAESFKKKEDVKKNAGDDKKKDNPFDKKKENEEDEDEDEKTAKKKTNELSKDDRAALDFAKNLYTENKKKLTAKITDNSNMTKEQLADMDVTTLEVIANGLKANEDYSGRSFPHTNTDSKDRAKGMNDTGVLAFMGKKQNKGAA